MASRAEEREPSALRAVFRWDSGAGGDWKRETGKRGTVKNAWPENAELENAAPNCRTGNRGKRHVWKAKRYTSHVVFNRISDTDEGVLQYHSKQVA